MSALLLLHGGILTLVNNINFVYAPWPPSTIDKILAYINLTTKIKKLSAVHIVLLRDK